MSSRPPLTPVPVAAPIRRWLNAGQLNGTLTVDSWTVDESDLSSFLDNRTTAPSGLDRHFAGLDGRLECWSTTSASSGSSCWTFVRSYG
jgi:hypothetical protein